MTDRALGRQQAHAALDFFEDQHPPAGDFLRDALDGFAATPKRVPPVYFYDAKGSGLFDQITDLEEYYVTRTELSILDSIMPELAERAGPGAVVVEPGSGSSVKIRKLLDGLDNPAGYLGLDISKTHLINAVADLAESYADVSVGAVCADFTGGLNIDHLPLPEGRRVIFFPGSTVGNFEPDAARNLLKGFRNGMRSGDAVLIGADRVKDEARLVAAYDDAEGVTAQFNLNLINRINRELDGTIDAGALKHLAIWNSEKSRIEMHLEAKRDMRFAISGEHFEMKKGERIHTENSHKFTLASFSTLAESAGFTVTKTWSDAENLFTLFWLEPCWEA
ncbi:MAG: L-histidine N(alpha)-methyltransferase [Alphaproteobacteria bacterium]|nr:L-histidine N(alpha)-methyltransferase [Alphaproteobacteria bacterium]